MRPMVVKVGPEIEGLFERPIYLELEIHMEGYGVSQDLGWIQRFRNQDC